MAANDPGIKSQIAGIVVRPTGRMNKDLDPRYLRDGDFIDSLNTRAVTDAGGTTNSREVIPGTAIVDVFPAVPPFTDFPLGLQNKEIQIRFPNATAPGTVTLNFYDANGNLMFTTNTPFLAVSGVLIAQAVAADVDLAFLLDPVYSANVGTGPLGNVIIEFTGYPAYAEYYVESVADGDPTIFTSLEAIDQSLLMDGGQWHCIGSYDMESQLFSWWTTQRHLPEFQDISSINVAGGEIQVNFGAPHNIASNFLVTITGSGYANLNGAWVVSSLSLYSIVLQGSVWAGAPPLGTLLGQIKKYVSGIGAVLYSEKNRGGASATWRSVVMLQAKGLNLVTQHQIKATCKKQSGKQRYTFTDFYNPPRVLYNNVGEAGLPLSRENSLLKNNPDGINIGPNEYTLEGIDEETRFFVGAPKATLAFLGQDQTGGALLSGNLYYAFRLFNTAKVATEWLPIAVSNPIPVAKASEVGAPDKMFGSGAGEPTFKQNRFRITGDLLGLYEYVELAVTDGFDGSIPVREEITSDIMDVVHRGDEVDAQDLDTGEISAIRLLYTKALTVNEHGGRVVFSNLETSPTIDLTDWFLTWQHSLYFDSLESAGEYQTQSFSDLLVGQYQLSNNVHFKMGGILNERYRIGAMVKFKKSTKTTVYWVDDITFDDQAYARRVTALADWDLSDNTGSAASNARTFWISFFGFDLDAKVSGDSTVRDLVEEIYIMVAPVENRQVLGSGLLIPAVSGTLSDTGGGVGAASDFHWRRPAGIGTVYGEFPFIATVGPATHVPAGYDYGAATADVSNFVMQRQYASFYFIDQYYGYGKISPSAGDRILFYGQPQNSNDIADPPLAGWAGTGANYYVAQRDGSFANIVKDSIVIAEGHNIPKGGEVQFSTGIYYSKLLHINAGGNPLTTGVTYLHHAESGLALRTTNTGGASPWFNDDANNPPASGTNRGFNLAQYFREIPNADDQYGPKEVTRYMFTGAIFVIDDSIPTGPTPDGAWPPVYVGDCFTQRSWFKNRYQTSTLSGWGQGAAIYSQNKANFDMRQSVDSTSPTITKAFPDILASPWLLRKELDNYAYTAYYNNNKKNIGLYVPFTEAQASAPTTFKARLIWSEKEFPEASSDHQREFLPNNFFDLDYSDGEIVHHATGNDEIYAWQPDQFSRLFFDSNALINTTGGSEVVLGDGGVMSRTPLRLSRFGCSDPHGVVPGISAQGGDTFYWLCKRRFAMLRFGYDGTTDKGSIAGMDSFIRNNLNFAIDKRAPAHDEGIHGVWNHAFKEAILTCRSWRGDIEKWGVDGGYNPGDQVYWGHGGPDDVILFWTANDYTNPGDEPGVSLLWDPVSFTDPDYYNIWSLVYSEIKNGYDGFVSFRPRIYLGFENGFLSTQPSSPRNIYEHDRGPYSTFYGTPFPAHWHGVLNYDPEESKSYLGVRVKSEVVPSRLDLSNYSYKTYMEASDFELREEKFEAPVTNDSSITIANPLGLNSLRTTRRVPGDHLQIKMTYDPGVYQRLFSVTVRTALRPRLKNT